jgi:hypothetical protein
VMDGRSFAIEQWKIPLKSACEAAPWHIYKDPLSYSFMRSGCEVKRLSSMCKGRPFCRSMWLVLCLTCKTDDGNAKMISRSIDIVIEREFLFDSCAKS